jgi:hypothetical protein
MSPRTRKRDGLATTSITVRTASRNRLNDLRDQLKRRLRRPGFDQSDTIDWLILKADMEPEQP